MARPRKRSGEPLTPTHDKIVGVATQLFLETGYAGTSINAVARAAGIQKASLYHHFESKEALLFACFQGGYAETVARMREVANDEKLTFEQRLDRVLDEVYNGVVFSDAGKMVAVVAETTGRIPEVAQRFNDEFIEEMHEIFNAFAEAGMTAGAFDTFDLDALDHALFGVAVNLTLCRSMFVRIPALDQRYDVATVKAQHRLILRKLLGLEG